MTLTPEERLERLHKRSRKKMLNLLFGILVMTFMVLSALFV